MSDPVATPIPQTLRVHGTSSGTLATGGVVAMFGTFGGLAIGVLLTLAIGAAITFLQVGRAADRRVDPISPRDGITEERMFELLKAEREAHKIATRELAEKYEALRSNVAQWQAYCENTRCRCRHPGAPGSPGVGAVGSAVMESAPPKVGDKP